jgi:hypothetical protein
MSCLGKINSGSIVSTKIYVIWIWNFCVSLDYMTHVVIARACHMIQFNVYGNKRKCIPCVVLLVESDEPCWGIFFKKFYRDYVVYSENVYNTFSV